MKVPKELRVLLYSILVLFGVAICLITFGKVDDVIQANGIIRTKANISSIKNVISGKIIEINYRPGQFVSKGMFLYKIDPSIYDSQKDNLISEQKNYKERLNGLDELIYSYNTSRNFVSKENAVAYSRFESFKNNVEKLKIQENISYEALKTLENLPYSLKNPQEIKQKKLEYEYAKKSLQSFKADFYNSIITEKKELELIYYKNEKEINQLDSQYEFLKVYAPIDGYVQEISALNLNDYIESGKNVLNIIPNDSKNFKVEMFVSPKDMGKVKPGLKVKYRLSAFPFFEYKGATGVITSVDPDMRTDESGKLYYIINADIDRVVFENKKGESFPIKAGLETNSYIVLERNSIISYILRKIDFVY